MIKISLRTTTIVCLILLLSSSHSYSVVYDNLNGSTLDTSTWTGFPSGTQFINYMTDSIEMGFQNHQDIAGANCLESYTTEDGGVLFTGNFDLIVSWSDITPTQLSTEYRYHVGMDAAEYNDQVYRAFGISVDFIYNSNTGTIDKSYGSGFWDVDHIEGDYKWVSTDDTEGCLRIKREGSTFSCYYLDKAGNWERLNTIYPENFGDVYVKLFVSYEAIEEGSPSESISFSAKFNSTVTNPGTQEDDGNGGDGDGDGDGSNFCFIATATYGSPMAEQVVVLKKLRDSYLLTNALGTSLANFYYKVSPLIANFITRYE